MSKHITDAEVAFCRTDRTMGDRRQMADEVARLRRALRKAAKVLAIHPHCMTTPETVALRIIDRALGRKGKS